MEEGEAGGGGWRSIRGCSRLTEGGGRVVAAVAAVAAEEDARLSFADGEAGAIHSNEALGHDVAHQLLRRPDLRSVRPCPITRSLHAPSSRAAAYLSAGVACRTLKNKDSLSCHVSTISPTLSTWPGQRRRGSGTCKGWWQAPSHPGMGKGGSGIEERLESKISRRSRCTNRFYAHRNVERRVAYLAPYVRCFDHRWKLRARDSPDYQPSVLQDS
jgi:hypothetical protein